MSLRYVRAPRLSKQRVVLLAAFVIATSLSMVAASYGSASSTKTEPGYWLASSNGAVNAFGSAGRFGSLSPGRPDAPIVGIAETPDAGGYWLTTSSGKVYTFGDAPTYGSLTGLRLDKPIVGIASTPDGGGYWLVAADGGVFAFGDAGFFGSVGSDHVHLESPVVAMAGASGGSGYWLATRSGDILRFGSVPFVPAGVPASLGSGVVSMAATPDGKGLWLVTSNGRVTARGDARYYGSLSKSLNASVVGIAPTASGGGYWLVAGDGGVFSFGNAQYVGSAPGQRIFASSEHPATTAQVVSGIAISNVNIRRWLQKHHHGGSPTTTTTASTTTTTQPTTSTTHATTTTTGSTTTTTSTGSTCTDPNYTTTDPNGGNTYGAYYVYNNMWNDGSPPPYPGVGSQQLNVCNYNSWYVNANMPAGNTAVLTYPNVQETFGSPIPLSKISSMTSDFAESAQHLTGDDWEAAYDIWINGEASSGSTELMIWNDTDNQTPSGNDVGTFTSNGVTYTIYNSNNSYIAFVANSNYTAGQVNLNAFYQELLNKGWIASNSQLYQVDYGYELCSTNSQVQRFNVTNFDINYVTGGGATTTTTAGSTTTTRGTTTTTQATTSTTHATTTTVVSSTTTVPSSTTTVPSGVGAPAPVPICSTSTLSGPSSAPSGAVTVPAGSNSSLFVNQTLPADTTYWFAPGEHTLGTGEYNQIAPSAGDTFIGAPGAILNGQGVNQVAFGDDSSNVAIEYLTIEDFAPPGGEGAVNHDGGPNWTVEYDTLTLNSPGAALMLGTNSVSDYNCMTLNGEYAFNGYSGYDTSSVTGGPSNITMVGNEISYNNTCNWDAVSPNPVPPANQGAGCAGQGESSSCGCAGGGKFWMDDGALIQGNYVHDNYGDPGMWVDTDNTGFTFEDNNFDNNWAEGLMYEISYNFVIENNTFVGNAVQAGPTNEGFGFPAIYISESGGDTRVPGPNSGEAIIKANAFDNNWGGVLLWENANRFCSDGSDGVCTLVNPSVFTLASCAANLATAKPGTNTGSPPADYYDGCRWKTQNVQVTDNDFDFSSSYGGFDGQCTEANTCGQNGLFSIVGVTAPYNNWNTCIAISNEQNNVFSDNTYVGPWTFSAFQAGEGVTFSQWTQGFQDGNVPNGVSGQFNGQDAGSTLAS